MSMSIDRAIEILDPARRHHFDSIEPVNEACRMGMQALALLRWKKTEEELPRADDGLVLVVCRADLSNNCKFLDAIQLAEYYEEDNVWELEGWPEAENVTVSHWMRLPELPEEGV